MTHNDADLSTPEALMSAFSEHLNAGRLDELIELYEPGATFEPQPGVVVRGHAAIRDALGALLALSPRLDSRIEQVLEAGDIALVANEWSMHGTDADGSPVTLGGRSADVLRRQVDGRWLVVVDRP
jgi:ketosteroid isomerase-like protein